MLFLSIDEAVKLGTGKRKHDEFGLSVDARRRLNIKYGRIEKKRVNPVKKIGQFDPEISEVNEWLSSVVDHLWSQLDEAEKTPYQKAMLHRRQTVAAHTARPAKQSIFYKHAVRAVFNKLKGKRGEPFRKAASGAQQIARHMLTTNGYALGHKTGSFSLTSKGMSRNVKHSKEPAAVRQKKERAYDHILGIQRKEKQQKAVLKAKASGAG